MVTVGRGGGESRSGCGGGVEVEVEGGEILKLDDLWRGSGY